jgi:hypothetical protein
VEEVAAGAAEVGAAAEGEGSRSAGGIATPRDFSTDRSEVLP